MARTGQKSGPLFSTVTSEKIERFLETLSMTCHVGISAKACALSRTTLYALKRLSPCFANRWHAAIEESISVLEDAVTARALHGVKKPVFQGGKQVGSVIEYSDSLLMFKLKKHRPEYRESFKIETSGVIQHDHQVSGVLVVPADKSIDEWQEENSDKEKGNGEKKQTSSGSLTQARKPRS